MKTNCLVLLDKNNDIHAVYMSNEDRDIGMHNMGITKEKYEQLGFHFVIGKLEVPDENNQVK